MLTKIINVDDLIGKRYKHNGRGRDGYDCYGLAMEVSKRYGHELPEPEIIAIDNDVNRKETVKNLNVKEKEKPSIEGDLLLINDSKGVFSHIGVYLGEGKFIHCNLFGVHINKLSDYEGRIGRVYEWQ